MLLIVVHLFLNCYSEIFFYNNRIKNTFLTFIYLFVFISYRKSQDRERDLKLLLDMYKTVPKDTREKAQV